jgi:CheY-like chemotaxis protein
MPTTCTPTARGQRRVLLVEDSKDNRETLRVLLGMWDFEVEVAEDGPGGIRAALDWEPDIAILDIGLPGLDGYEVARRVRQAFGDRVRLIALTGYAGAEDRRLALEAGFDEHLAKGSDLDILKGKLRAAV